MAIEVRLNEKNILDLTEEELIQIFGDFVGEKFIMAKDCYEDDDEEGVFETLMGSAGTLNLYAEGKGCLREYISAYSDLKLYENTVSSSSDDEKHKELVLNVYKTVGIEIS